MGKAHGRKFSPKRVRKLAAVAEKERKALELRKAGGKYDDIAKECGYQTRQGAQAAVLRALHELTAEPAAELLTLYQQRLDRMYLGLVKEGAHDGDPRAVLAAVRVLEMHAKLSGHLRNDQAATVVAPVVINVSPEWVQPVAALNAPGDEPSERLSEYSNGNGETH